jgi:uncharacterized damage-inducible protein DinB
MTDALREVFRHDAWANLRLIDYCAELDDAQLQATATGVYGNPLQTLKHMLGAASFYRSLFTGRVPHWNWQEDTLPSSDELRSWAEDMAQFWDQLLSSSFEPDLILERPRRDGSVGQIPASVMLLQALHHGNVHREQVSSIITSLGLQPPDVSGWAYGRETGQIT